MGKYDDYIEQYKGDLDPNVIKARIKAESGGNPNVVAKPQQWASGHGSEIGLLQMSPDTRKQYKISEEQAKDPEINLRTQLKQWNRWSKSFFGKNPPPSPVARNTWAWLVTSVGPGAARRIRQLTGGDYSLGKLAQVANSPEVLAQNKNYWGSQSPQLVAKRIKSGIRNVTGAMGMMGREPRSKTMAGPTLSTAEREKLADIAINKEGKYTPKQQAAALKQIRSISAAESEPVKLAPGPSAEITKPAEPVYTQDPRSKHYGLSRVDDLTKKYGTKVVVPEKKKEAVAPAPAAEPEVSGDVAASITAPVGGADVTSTVQKTTRGFEPTEQLAQMEKEREKLMERKVKIGAQAIEEKKRQDVAEQERLGEYNKIYDRQLGETNAVIKKLRGYQPEPVGKKLPGGEIDFTMPERKKGKIDLIEDKLRQADADLKQAIDDVSKYDTKYEMPWSTRIRFMIAAAFSGFANGFGVRGNAALDMMNAHINREVDARKRKLKQLIEVRGYRKEHRAKVKEALDSYEEKLKAHMLRKAQIEVAKLDIRGKQAASANGRADVILGIKEKLVDLEQKTKKEITKEEIRAKEKAAPVTVEKTERKPSALGTWLWKEKVKAALKAAGKTGDTKDLPNKVLEQIVGLKSARKEIGRMGKAWTKESGLFGPEPVSAWIAKNLAFTEQGTYDAWRRRIALSMAARDNEGRPSDKDYEAILPNIPGWNDTWKSANKKFQRLKTILEEKSQALREVYGQTRYRKQPLRTLDPKFGAAAPAAPAKPKSYEGAFGSRSR